VWALSASIAAAQSGLAGAYADGQVFLRWTLSPDPVLTYDIYASALPQTDTSNMTLVGRVFPEEATCDRLHNARATGSLRVPTDSGYTVLTPEQGAFAWTPHQSGALFFAVVVHGQTSVTDANRVWVQFGYDPVNEPVKPHFQFTYTTPGGYPVAAWVVWVDGRSDPEDGRPDFPVMANERRGGVPHIFLVATPISGVPNGPYPAVFSLHGGGGGYANFLPGQPDRASLSLELTNGIVIAPDDCLYWRTQLNVRNDVTSWFGYANTFDPFITTGQVDPPSDATIVNYTARRVLWFTNWLTSGAGPYNVDPHRVAVIGHSAGSRGASHLSRQAPHTFSAAVIHNSLLNFRDYENQYPPAGSFSQGLHTNLLSPDTSQPLTYQEVLSPWVRLSDAPFIPLTRLYVGKRDVNDFGGWTPEARAGLDACDGAQLGIIVNWDEREHGVEDWASESPPSVNDPCAPWPDVGQWIAPIRSDLHTAQYLVDRFRNDRSYPGVFDVDADLQAAGRQPDPGTGDPCSGTGAAWGSWGGYVDWSDATVVDVPDRWECSLFLRSTSPVSIDNTSSAVMRVSLAPRRTQQFHPAAGATVRWALRVPENGAVIQAGDVVADGLGVPKVLGLLIPREDLARARLSMWIVTPCDPDYNQDGNADQDDIAYLVNVIAGGPNPTGIDPDFSLDGNADQDDIAALINVIAGGGCP